MVDLAKEQKMVTDVKKQIFKVILASSDYLQAYQSLCKLNLKKKQEREIVKVLTQLCLNEQTYNHFYTLLAQHLCRLQNHFKFSFQYTLWDYLKVLSKLEISQINNLAKMFGTLIGSQTLPLAFLKGMDLGQDELSKSQILFLHLLLD